MALETGVVPKALLSRPELARPYRHHLEAFYDLSSGRVRGEAPQAITTAEIKAYCDLFEIHDQGARETLFRLVRTLDAAYLNKTISELNAK